jgi:hypothetical protein
MPEWEELVAQAEVYELEGREIRVMNRATLIGLSEGDAVPDGELRVWLDDLLDDRAAPEGRIHVITSHSAFPRSPFNSRHRV